MLGKVVQVELPQCQSKSLEYITGNGSESFMFNICVRKERKRDREGEVELATDTGYRQ